MENPTNLEFQKKFDTIAETYEDISNLYTLKRRSESLNVKPDSNVLEVGAGTGIVTKQLRGSIVCSDISFKMCKQAKSKRTSVICCDAEKIPFRDNTFDAIISAEMIYCLQNPENFIFDSRRILKKGGQILISMANQDMAIVTRIRAWLRKLGAKRMMFDDGVKYFMKLERLESLLKKYNFQITSIHKQVILPFSFFDKMNRKLERTPLNYFCIFVIVKATCV